MSRKDYELIARVFREAHRENLHGPGYDRLACLLADAFSEGNPRFDRGRFLKACEVGA